MTQIERIKRLLLLIAESYEVMSDVIIKDEQESARWKHLRDEAHRVRDKAQKNRPLVFRNQLTGLNDFWLSSFRAQANERENPSKNGRC